MTRLVKIASILISAMIPAIASANRVATPTPGHVTKLISGWVANQMAVSLDITHYNPHNCPDTNQQHATNPGDPGANLHHSLLLGALLSGKAVTLWIDPDNGSPSNRPLIIGLQVTP